MRAFLGTECAVSMDDVDGEAVHQRTRTPVACGRRETCAGTGWRGTDVRPSEMKLPTMAENVRPSPVRPCPIAVAPPVDVPLAHRHFLPADPHCFRFDYPLPARTYCVLLIKPTSTSTAGILVFRSTQKVGYSMTPRSR